MIIKYSVPLNENPFPNCLEFDGSICFENQITNSAIGVATSDITSSEDLPEGVTELSKTELINYVQDLIDNQIDNGDGSIITGDAESLAEDWCTEYGQT